MSDNCAKPSSERTREMPRPDYMDAAEVLTWIAFRRAIPEKRWDMDLYGFLNNWPFRNAAFFNGVCAIQNLMEMPGGPSAFLELLEKYDELHYSKKNHFLASHMAPQFIKDFLLSMLRKEVTEEIVRRLKDHMSSAATINAALHEAAGTLRRKLENGALRCVGRRPTAEQGSTMGLQPIPTTLWSIGALILPDSTLREMGDIQAKYQDLLFDAAEVIMVWPERKLTLDRENSSPKNENEENESENYSSDIYIIEKSINWMLGYAQGYFEATKTFVKREHAVRMCRAAMQCTDREAKEAFKCLPGNLRHPARSETATTHTAR